MKKTFLLTGGAGFIGVNLSKFLIKQGHKVVVVDDLSAGYSFDRLPTGVTSYKADIRDVKNFNKYFDGIDVVVHLAALPRVQFSIENPIDTHDVNVMGTLSVLEAARNNQVKKVVFISSSAVYGDQEQMPLNLNFPVEPKSPYALHKYFGERMMKLWSELYGVNTVSLRLFNVYGPDMDPNGAYALVVGLFFRLLSEGKKLTITGDGNQTRDFIHVYDVASAIVKASLSDNVNTGQVLNVGFGKEISINELAKIMMGDKNDNVEYTASRIEPKRTCADISETVKILNWRPEVQLTEGIKVLKQRMGLE